MGMKTSRTLLVRRRRGSAVAVVAAARVSWRGCAKPSRARAGTPEGKREGAVHPALEDGRFEGRRVARSLADRWIPRATETMGREKGSADPEVMLAASRRSRRATAQGCQDLAFDPLVREPRRSCGIALRSRTSASLPIPQKKDSRREGVMSDWRPVATRPTSPCLGGPPVESVVSAR